MRGSGALSTIKKDGTVTMPSFVFREVNFELFFSVLVFAL